MIKYYGPEAADPALEAAVVSRLQELSVDALVLRYPRIPIDARPCQQPLLLRFEVVINGRAYEAKQVGSKITLGF